MTKAVTNRRVLPIALPIVLSNATIPILGAVDTGVIGQLGEAAPIGAVGMGAVILASIYWVFGFLRMGTSGLVAQAHGAGDMAEGGAHLVRALSIALIAGLALIVLHPLLFGGAFWLAPASPEVESLASRYLSIRIWGAPATIALYAITGWLIAMERTRGVLALQLLQNGLNVALDLWFVLGLGLGVGGVAAATLIAELAGLGLGLWLCRSALRAAVHKAGLFARDKLIRLARVNTDIMIRSILLQGSFTTFMFMAAGEGDLTLAANQVLLQFLEITAYALDGFAFAAETLVGQAIGAQRRDLLRRSVIVSSRWAVGGALLLSVLFLAFGPMLIDLLTTSPEVRVEARRYLPWLVVAPAIGIASWMFDGIFIGATLTHRMRRAMIESVAIYAAALLVLPGLLGNAGLWASLMLLNTVRALTMARFYPEVESSADG
ncbi:MATE family efflux transporter [Paracoccus aurantiacus]|uniref:MATE family efflux transporter n=1 Tax=Paracoccus aurantiacus TaxID=2599412 RepID=A0A5C6S447_9RHOB|nr:MATE family efflux transporter [Paracoccus aurantiacus]TXB68760.1 MATE family efflux transporter [Paracoccus aurantiacus]